MITILVGPEERRFNLHKKLLCQRSSFFTKAFEGGFAEAEQSTMRLVDVNIAAFGLFVDWVYRDSLNPIVWTDLDTIIWNDMKASLGTKRTDDRCAINLARERPYHEVYYLADKWCLDDLKKLAMDAIQAFHELTKTDVHPCLIDSGFRNTVAYPGSKKFRRYLAEEAVHLLFDKPNSVKNIADNFEILLAGRENLHPDLVLEMLSGPIRRHIAAVSGPWGINNDNTGCLDHGLHDCSDCGT